VRGGSGQKISTRVEDSSFNLSLFFTVPSTDLHMDRMVLDEATEWLLNTYPGYLVQPSSG